MKEKIILNGIIEILKIYDNVIERITDVPFKDTSDIKEALNKLNSQTIESIRAIIKNADENDSENLRADKKGFINYIKNLFK